MGWLCETEGVAPMAAWTCTGAVTMAALLVFAHPAALGWGLPGAAAAIGAEGCSGPSSLPRIR